MSKRGPRCNLYFLMQDVDYEGHRETKDGVSAVHALLILNRSNKISSTSNSSVNCFRGFYRRYWKQQLHQHN